MSEKSRATVKPKSDNSVFHALRPGSSQSTHSLSGTEPLIIPPVQEGLNRRINFSGRTYKDSWNQRENASSIPGRHNFSRIRIHPEGTVLPIQPKLRINKPGDIYEQEADRVAEQVMGMPVIQAKSICPDSSCEEDEELVQARPKKITPLVQRQVEEEDEEESLQTMNMGGSLPEVTHDLESRIHSLKGGGQPLSESDRAFFELRFGHDFSQVWVHKDEMGAQAFTLVQDVVFGTEYALNLRNTLLRIRGAIQVLIAKEGGQQPGGSMGEVHEPEEGIESG